MSDVIITYNGNRIPASGTGPTPYISLNDDVFTFGDRWGLGTKISLNGLITGCAYGNLYSGQTGLVGLFSNSYKTLQVLESADDQNSYSPVYSFSGCSVDNISFSEAPYLNVVSYTVELTSYPSGLTGYFSGNYGVLDPKDEINISEGDDGFGTISRTVSARGFVTNSIDTAINNAKNYVAGRTGITSILEVSQISGFQNSGSFTPVLVQIAENLDRLSLTYSVEQTYRFKMISGDSDAKNNYSFNNYYLTTYSTSISSGAGDDFVSASIQGEIKAGITGATGDALVLELISQLSGLSPYSIISGKYGAPNSFDFCKDPIDFSVTQDLKARKINFNASYDNLDLYGATNNKYVYSGCYLDATISHAIDELTKTTIIQVRGDIKARGSTSNRYYNTLEYLGVLMQEGSSASQPRLYDFANDYYTTYIGTSSPIFALNTKPTNIVINSNSILGTISVDVTYDNKDRFSGLTASDYNVSYEPYNTIFSYASSCNDSIKHLAVDMNVQKREKVSINLKIAGSGKSELTLINNAKSLIEPDTAGSFYNSFPKLLAVGDSVQEEISSLNVDNSSSKTPLTSNQYGAEISLNKTYSYELIESEKNTRRIVKSAGNIGNI
jgi:hypothetical protein